MALLPLAVSGAIGRAVDLVRIFDVDVGNVVLGGVIGGGGSRLVEYSGLLLLRQTARCEVVPDGLDAGVGGRQLRLCLDRLFGRQGQESFCAIVSW